MPTRRLPAHADALVIESFEAIAVGPLRRADRRPHPLLKLVAWAMNLRSRLTGIATGDQAIFVRRDAFAGLSRDRAHGGHRVQQGDEAPRAAGLPARARHDLRPALGARGVLRTILLMWRLRLLYFLGARPERLARLYEP